MSNIKKYNEFNNINEAGGYDSPGQYNLHSYNTVTKLVDNLHMMSNSYINMKILEEEIMVNDELKKKINTFLKEVKPLLPAMHELDMFLFDTYQDTIKRFNKR